MLLSSTWQLRSQTWSQTATATQVTKANTVLPTFAWMWELSTALKCSYNQRLQIVYSLHFLFFRPARNEILLRWRWKLSQDKNRPGEIAGSKFNLDKGTYENLCLKFNPNYLPMELAFDVRTDITRWIPEASTTSQLTTQRVRGVLK